MEEEGESAEEEEALWERAMRRRRGIHVVGGGAWSWSWSRRATRTTTTTGTRGTWVNCAKFSRGDEYVMLQDSEVEET